MRDVVFSIYIDIPESKLDNPGYFLLDGTQVKSEKSHMVKTALKQYEQPLNKNKKDYADAIGADYILYGDDRQYYDFCKMFREKYSQISEYDIINFYKHWLMRELAEKYDRVCYLDYDVVVNTVDNIFDAHNSKAFACAENNFQAEDGKKKAGTIYYIKDIRNPATKYWNCHAMLMEEGLDPDTDVFNTGIMVATSDVIRQLGYFDSFEDVLQLMSKVKYDSNSMYPANVQRVFNYDNETVFAYLRVINNIEIDYINDDWHCMVFDHLMPVGGAKMYHMISKQFGLLL